MSSAWWPRSTAICGLRARQIAQSTRRHTLKSELIHYGASVPVIRAVAKAAARRHPLTAHDELVAVAEALWVVPVHERRMATVDLLDLGNQLLAPADAVLLE